MASNDGARLSVYGLTFRQYDSRKMQQILREYRKSPENPNDRASSFAALVALAKELGDEENEAIRNWIENGGVFPSPQVENKIPEFGRYQTPPPIQAWRGRGGRAGRGGGFPGLGRGRGGGPATDGRPINSWAFQGAGQSLGDGPDEIRQLMETREAQRNHELHKDDDGDENMDAPGGPSSGSNNANEMPLYVTLGYGSAGEMQNALDEEELQAQAEELVDRDEDENENEDNDSNATEDEADKPDESEDDSMEGTTGPEAAPIAPLPNRTHNEPADTKECEVCMDKMAIHLFPATKISPQCDHETAACSHCIAEHIRYAVDENALHRINCPICDAKLTSAEIKLYATPVTFGRYEFLSMTSDPDTVMCLGPNCGRGQIHKEPKENPKMTCNSCGFATCAYHKYPWHEGMTCSEFDHTPEQIERYEDERETAKLLAGSTKICPACKNGITKNEGCDHLMCRCGAEYCFVCMASWDNVMRIGGEAHAPTCIYHPRQSRLRPDQIAAIRNRMTELVHGGEVSEELEKARQERMETRRRELRPLAAAAAEARMRANKDVQAEVTVTPAKRKGPNLHAPWKEGR